MTSSWDVIAVVGPTASGKSRLAEEIALAFTTEIVSADAMQVYRHMDVGTAKIPPEQRRVPIRCIDLVEPDQTYSVALYADAAHQAIDDLIAQGGPAVVCGGTGLYVRAALEDMEFPAGEQIDNPVRERYMRYAEEHGADGLYALLAERDPESAELIHPHNVRRVVRAFELLEEGTSYAREHAGLHEHHDRHPSLLLGISLPREELYRRIDARVDAMIEDGLVGEVRRLAEAGLANTSTARQAIGYKEILGVLDGTCTLEEAIHDIKQSTRRYAKRQLTWFGADPRIKWLDATGGAEALREAALALLQEG